ncbi:hypothetical protein ABBQ38_015132 [Trebouxia sp. C0009 RCD-2024]
MGCTSQVPAPTQIRAVEAANADLSAQRNEFHFKLPKRLAALCLPLLLDKRDLPILHLFFNIAVTVLPASLALYCLPAWSAVLGPVYLAATYVLFLERYLLALHYSQHRQLFKTDYRWLNHVAPMLLAPLFGVPCGLYRLHHCVMHHAENNWYPKDLSSTEPYQRDNFFQFLFYWVRYLVGIWLELPLYAMKARRWGMAGQCLSMELLYFALVTALWHLNTAATVWTLVVPLVITSFALMFGNWSQHIFIDPDKPRSAHGMSYNCVDFSGNQRSFNDGYHTTHHLNSKLHWTELPQQFILTAEQGMTQGLVFGSIGFFDVGLAVFLGRFDMLSKQLLSPVSHQGTTELLKERLKPVLYS